MDLDAAQAAVERACEEFRSPATAAAASSTLLAFRSAPGVLQVCRHILDRSPSLDARFHAAAALREAVVRDWATLGPDGRAGLRAYLLSYLVAHAEDPGMAVVRSTLVSAAAVLAKRSWLEAGEGEAFFRELDAATASAPTAASPAAAAAALLVGIALLESTVGEFCVATASPLGLPLEHHAKCAADLQENYLQGIFRHAVGLGRAAAASGDGSTAAACLSLLAAVLAWDFRRSPTAPHPAALRPPAARPPGSGAGAQAPAPSAGSDWASLLLAPDTLDWVAALLSQLSAPGAASSREARELVDRARAVVVAMCNLSPDVFPREGADALSRPGGGVRGGYLRAVLRCVVAWVASPREVVAAAAAGDEAPLWEACKAILALATAHPPRMLEDAGNDVLAAAGTPAAAAASGGGGFLALLQALTLEVIRASCAYPAHSLEQWASECRDMLVEAWALMVQRDSSGANQALLPLAVGGLGPPTLPGLAEAAAGVFSGLVEAALTAADREAAGEGDDWEEVAAENEAAEAEAEDARMAEAAALARAAPAAAFPLLAAAMAAAQQQLLAAAAGGGSGGPAWASALERLCWLVRMAAHALADSGAGETPLMPLPLSLAAEGGGGAAAVGAVVGLTQALLELPALALREGASSVLSPRLMESVVWALARWADTYLFPEEAEAEGLPPALVSAYATRGPGSGAESVADGIARLACTCLVKYPGEFSLHAAVCTTLLPVLSRRRPLCACLLDASPAWNELAGAMASRQPALTAGLEPKLQRWLAQCLAQAACGFPSSTPAESPHVGLAAAAAVAAAAAANVSGYINRLLGPTAAEVRSLAARPDLAALTSRADVAAALIGMLEVLRGGACRGVASAGPAARVAAWGLLAELLGPLLALQAAFGEHPGVGGRLLKLAAAVVEHHVGYLPTDQAHMLMGWVLGLLRQYRQGRAARVSVAAAVAAAAEAAAGGRRPGGGGASGAAALAADAAHDAARELKALLELLTHITQRDVALAAAASEGWGADSSAGSTPRSVNMGAGGGAGGTPRAASNGNAAAAAAAAAEADSGVAQVVLTGLDVLLPLLTPELLAAATAAGAGGGGGGGTGGKLARLLFSLLGYMTEVHPAAVVALPPPHFTTLLSCLEAGARGAISPPAAAGQAGGAASGGAAGSSAASGFDGVVVQSALEGLAGLAKFHHQSLLNGGRGFVSQTAPASGGGGGGGPLAPYLVSLLLEVALLGDAGPEVVELVGDGLLPLLQAEPAAFQGLGTALVQNADPRVQGQVGAALARLVAPDAAAAGGAANGGGAAAVAAAANMGLDTSVLDLGRLGRRAFKERLCGVVAELRGLLRVR